jgi:hypothetical protein
LVIKAGTTEKSFRISTTPVSEAVVAIMWDGTSQTMKR